MLVAVAVVGILVFLGIVVWPTHPPASAQLVSQFKQELHQAGVKDASCSLSSDGKAVVCRDKEGDYWRAPIYRDQVPPPNIPPSLQRRLAGEG